MIALFLAALVAGVWVSNTGLWNAEHWTVPAAYGGDGLQILGWIQAGSEGDYHFFGPSFVTRLGAPFEANWNDYPMYEKPFTIGLGYLARGLGTFAAANAGMMLVHMFAAISFYLVCRRFRWCRWWSAIGAIVFGLQYYISFRGQGHLLLSLIYTLPLAISAIWLLFGSKRIGAGSGNRRWCIAVSFLMGISSPYFLNIYLQLLLIGAVLHWLVHHRRNNLVAAGISFVVSAVGFIVAHNGMLLIRFLSGPNSCALARKVSEAEVYALRPIELFVPPFDHRWDPLGAIGRYYRSESAYQQDESLSAYLGVIGIVILVILCVQAVRHLTANRSRNVPLAFWLSAWVMLYSMVGGVNYALALGGIRMFRASNRYSVFIATMLLMWAVGQLHRRRTKWPVSLQYLAGVGLLTLAVWDQVPTNPRTETRSEIRAMVELDRDFGRLLEESLQPGAMVFQLPAADFPEGRPVRDMPAYDQLRPFMHTRDLRFSFGSNRGRMDAAWQFSVERLSPREMVAELQRRGFSALTVHRGGYPDRAERLLAALGQLGLPLQAVSEDHDFVLARLPEPNPKPTYPVLNTVPILNYGEGWVREDAGVDDPLWRIANRAELVLNPGIQPGETLRLNLEVAVAEAATICGSIGEEQLFRRELSDKSKASVTVTFDRPEDDSPLVVYVLRDENGTDSMKPIEFAVNNIRLERERSE